MNAKAHYSLNTIKSFSTYNANNRNSHNNLKIVTNWLNGRLYDTKVTLCTYGDEKFLDRPSVVKV